MFSKKLSSISVSPIKEIELKARSIENVISLAQGIPSFDTPQYIKESVKEALDRGLAAKYSLVSGLPVLREAIAESLQYKNIFIDYEEELIITSGATEALAASLIALLDTENEVIIMSPTYASYSEIIKLAGGTPIFVPLNEEKGWLLDTERIRDACTRNTKAILLCNPNNPTGSIYSKESLLALAALAEEKGITLIVDEVYRDFIYDETIHYFSIAEEPQFKDNVVRIFSFSKLYAMTGWRIGYVHSSKNNIKEILKAHDGLATCAPVISQYAALAALSLDQKVIKEHLRHYNTRKILMCKRMDSLKRYFEYKMPQSTYFLFPKLNLSRTMTSWESALDILKKARVAVVPGSAFGPSGEHHLRFMFGEDISKINEAFDRLEHYFNTFV